MSIQRLQIGAEDDVHQLIEDDGDPERRQQRDEQIAFDDAEDDDAIAEPAQRKQRDCPGRHAEQGMKSGLRHGDGDIAAQDDEGALADIDDVHDPPDQRHAIGRQRKDGADEHAIDQKLKRQRRRLDEEGQVIHARS